MGTVVLRSPGFLHSFILRSSSYLLFWATYFSVGRATWGLHSLSRCVEATSAGVGCTRWTLQGLVQWVYLSCRFICICISIFYLFLFPSLVLCGLQSCSLYVSYYNIYHSFSYHSLELHAFTCSYARALPWESTHHLAMY